MAILRVGKCGVDGSALEMVQVRGAIVTRTCGTLNNNHDDIGAAIKYRSS
jgi:hypothetical protein